MPRDTGDAFPTYDPVLNPIQQTTADVNAVGSALTDLLSSMTDFAATIPTGGSTPPPPPQVWKWNGQEFATEAEMMAAVAKYDADLRLKGIEAGIASDQALAAQQKAIADAQAGRQRTSASASVESWLKTFFDPTKDADTISQLMGFIRSQVQQDIPTDAIMLNIRQQKAYKDRFYGNEGLRAAGLAELDPATYLQAERTYDEILQAYGLGNLSNRAMYAKLIGGQVSAREAESRVANVYTRIANADVALRQEIQRLGELGNISASDFAEALLTGKEGADALRRKIAKAEVSTEFTARGITSALGAGELANLGVSRQQAQQGAEYAKTGTERLTTLAQIYGEQATGIQAELETEAFKGMQSQRRKKLVSQERAAFAGSSGAVAQSLGSQTVGKF